MIIDQIIAVLTRDLPSHLTYHAVAHTHDVISEVLLLGKLDKLNERELHLLHVAAAFHDAGHLNGPNEHETDGALMAQEAMRTEGGYSDQEISLVTQMILDTRLVNEGGKLIQQPKTDLSAYLLDADLANLGRDDFRDKMVLAKAELLDKSAEQYYLDLLNIMQSKIWYSKAGKSLRSEKHRENMREFKEFIGNTPSMSFK